MALEHIHPIVVHFPIVLLLMAVALDGLNVIKRHDLAGETALACAGQLALYSGAAAALVAVGFGYLAQGIAIDHGFDDSLIEDHEGLAVTTTVLFMALAFGRAVAVKLKYSLAGVRGWIAAALTAVAVVVLLAAAYHGGELVYNHGVNVAGVKGSHG